jgi:uncharacterized membrane protein HdeD (DUF308 family)
VVTLLTQREKPRWIWASFDGIIGILLAAYFAVRSSAASLRTTARRVKNGNAATVR